ncbi:ABC transporter substrate-binding protein [Scatolibacter rhodanostii]|uniref:ABC transporter substrate-binding protein n=1 Tax=Scatolibacter rhodanostii TaxID=2014781 RepID=UPI000C06F441|nr:ABC transporter substrate-binding protein [Scatolibacter rhodanostii]
MKKILSLSLVCLLLTALLAGCKGNDSKKSSESTASTGSSAASESNEELSEPNGAKETTDDKKTFKIGVVQIVEHEALDKAANGFIDSLTQYGEQNGITFEFDRQNAQNDQSNANTIASKFVNDKVDLIFAIATPAAQSAANAAKEANIPVLFTAVTDPVDAKLVADIQAPGGNVTGTSDLTPVEGQLELAKQLIPDLESIGVLYASNESNSKVQLEMAQAAAEKLGLKAVPASVSNANEVQSVVQNVLAGKVQAIYAPTDNTIANAMPTVSAIAGEYNLPIIAGEEGMVSKGGLATIGLNYYDLGVKTAELALDVLVDGKNPGEVPVGYIESYTYCYNSKIAEDLGFTDKLSADFLEKATDVAPKQ